MKRNYTWLLLSVIAFASCTSPKYYVYSPTPPVNPFFKDKGDTKISAYMTGASGTRLPGADLQAAYALTDNLAISGAFSTRRERDRYYKNDGSWSDSVVNYYDRTMGEVGAGYFTTINSKRTATFNLYGGFSWGEYQLTENGIDHQDIRYTRRFESDIKKWYVQPSIHFMPGKVFRIGLVTRFSFVTYDNIRTGFTDDELNVRTLNLVRDKTFFAVEPTVNFQFAFPQQWIKLDMGITFCPPYIDSYNYSELRYRTVSASIGLTFDLSKISSDKE